MAKFKILLTESMDQTGIDYLKERAEVIMAPSPEEEVLLKLVHDVDGLVLRARSRADRKLMDHAPKLKVVGRHGVGVDNVDVEEATKRGIQVVNTPLAVTEPVAEHTVMMMLALSRRLVEADKAVRKGDWGMRDEYGGRGMELKGKKLGIVGLGRIGRRLAEICHLGFGMEILYYDQIRYPEAESKLGALYVSLEELLAESHFVSLNVPLTDSTRHLIGERELGMMREESFLINTARGPVVDEKALVKALREGRIAGAGIDVYEVEPATPDNPLFQFENVVVTPHMAGHSREAMLMMSMVAEDIMRVLEGKEPKFPVNRPVRR